MASALFSRDAPPLTGAPPGVVPDLNAPNIHGQSIIAVSLTFGILAFLFVVARCATKIKSQKKLAWDDLLSIAAMLAAIARLVVSIVLVDKYDIGKHIWDVSPTKFTSDRNLQWIEDMIYLFGIMCAKLSLLVLLVTIFKPKKTFVKLCYVMMGVTVAYCLTFIFLYAFNCQPEYFSWHVSLNPNDNYHCIEIIYIIMAIGAVNLVTDLILLIMPLPLVFKLNLRRKQKVGVLLIFLTGVFVVITTLVRLIIVVTTLKEVDATYVSVDEINWLTIELDVAIICGCLPTLAPLYSKVLTMEVLPTSVRSFLSRSFGSASRSRSDRSTDGARKLGSSDGNSHGSIRMDEMSKNHDTFATVESRGDSFTNVPESRIGVATTLHQYSTPADSGKMV